MSKHTLWFERNEKAEALEAEGRIAEAVALYETNVREGCTTSYTYERLAAIYRNDARYEEEALTLARAVALERERGVTPRLARLRNRLSQAEAMREKTATERLQVARSGGGTPALRQSAGRRKHGCLGMLLVAGLTVASLAAGAALWPG